MKEGSWRREGRKMKEKGRAEDEGKGKGDEGRKAGR
jgi:hypothetical protein